MADRRMCLDGEESKECHRLLQLTNCRLVRGHRLIRDDLWVRDGRIVNPEPIFFDEQATAHRRVDCNNAIIAPGYIDLQINGGYGVDFSYDTETIEEGVEKVACGLVKSGVTSFCPTLVTSPSQSYHTILPRIPKAVPNGAGILGIHAEGPFINPQKKGAHPESCIRTIDKSQGLSTLESTYGSLDRIKILTLAPEKVTDQQVIGQLVDRGITVSLGHSMASLSDGEQAVQQGATLITHLFNAMLPFHHRDPGLVGLLASDAVPQGRTVYFGIISDGVHTHPAALRIAYRTHPQGLILVTDAISALGLEEGVHHIGQLPLEVKQGKAFIAGTETLCGSIAPMDECVRIFKKATDCSIVYAIEAATLHPAKCLKIEKQKGTLDFGSDADFIILDDELRVISTWIAGECVHRTAAK
ncbi:N-acetylglucosamine-6-phosphate deacetylase [Drosophila serrata]|uniref:N-acetylglucosamine-6-phosphate deacetylase n=1 Tax=Drosophila serrata TaxID=7274 RepID=UPI000A1D0F83|nr:N-acetylglucosamine-6-phosphate deacetylase [Drosophila serrata]XP_020802148.1 N-acetylglucosamine-6-phosphate deacetylase [Drosophila serrata]